LLAGVNPKPLENLLGFLKEADQSVQVLSGYKDVPIDLDVLEPSGVGIDRLLNALAVSSRRKAKAASVIVGVGSAVTVDVLDESGVFRGGAILPGLRLMAKALHDYTAKLPLVEVRDPKTSLPGRSTTEAMVLGIHNAVVGGIALLVHRYRAGFGIGDLWLSGGDGPIIVESLLQQLRYSGLEVSHWPEMTLEGIRLAGDRANFPVPK
jgi:type III pantothenate kinase